GCLKTPVFGSKSEAIRQKSEFSTWNFAFVELKSSRHSATTVPQSRAMDRTSHFSERINGEENDAREEVPQTGRVLEAPQEGRVVHPDRRAHRAEPQAG